jgi:hypothetical protein
MTPVLSRFFTRLSNRLSLFQGFAVGVLLLALNLYGVGPLVLERFGLVWGNGLFIAIRILVLLGFSAWVAARHGKTRMATVRYGTLLAFVDQIVLKGLLIAHDYWVNTADYTQGLLGSMIFQLFLSFVVFFPLLFILSLVGYEIGKRLFIQPEIQS